MKTMSWSRYHCLSWSFLHTRPRCGGLTRAKSLRFEGDLMLQRKKSCYRIEKGTAVRVVQCNREK
jgi:hypothetical protein